MHSAQTRATFGQLACHIGMFTDQSQGRSFCLLPHFRIPPLWKLFPTHFSSNCLSYSHLIHFLTQTKAKHIFFLILLKGTTIHQVTEARNLWSYQGPLLLAPNPALRTNPVIYWNGSGIHLPPPIVSNILRYLYILRHHWWSLCSTTPITS